jgi:hypothetical protein
MYVIASNQKQYSKPYVQGAHALAKFADEHEDHFWEWDNHTLIFLTTNNIDKDLFKLQKSDEIFSAFYEPDYDNKLTAVCVYSENKKVFDKYSLM